MPKFLYMVGEFPATTTDASLAKCFVQSGLYHSTLVVVL